MLTLQGCVLELRKEVREIALFMKEQFGTIATHEVEHKDRNSLVSHVDKAVELRLVHFLRTLIPDCGFITEEETVDSEVKEWTWIIDPLDGTTNYLYEIPTYSISIALQQKGVTQLGLIYEVVRDECFDAIRGQGAFLNSKPIRCSMRNSLEEALVATGFPYNQFDKLEKQLELVKDLAEQTRGIRRIGTAAVDLAYVACGRFDVYFEHYLNLWDVAAGILLVEEAGGVVSDFSGENDQSGMEIIASSRSLYEPFMQLVDKNYNK